jgi:hypothetical protein
LRTFLFIKVILWPPCLKAVIFSRIRQWRQSRLIVVVVVVVVVIIVVVVVIVVVIIVVVARIRELVSTRVVLQGDVLPGEHDVALQQICFESKRVE